MKTNFFLKNGSVYGMLILLLFASCQTDDISESTVKVDETLTVQDAEESDPTLRVNNSLVFPKTAHMFGKSSEAWAIEFGKYIVTLDCESFFINQMIKLGPNVVAPYSSSWGLSTDKYTIKKDQHIYLSPLFILIDYPCPPEYEFEPKEGQSVEDFLSELAAELLNGLENLEVYIDGTEIVEPTNYRVSTDLFYFTGNLSLAECFDPCITGEPQPAVIDSYFMMLKKLKVGKHHIQVKGEIPEADLDFDWNLELNVVD